MDEHADLSDSLKVQVTISGYAAWVLRQYQLRTTQSPAKYVEPAIERYIAGDAKFLANLGITHDRFLESMQGREVVRIRRRANPNALPDEPPRAG